MHAGLRAARSTAEILRRGLAPRRGIGVILLVLGLVLSPAVGRSFRVRGEPGAWARWDAAPRIVSGEERSLDGGLRYAIEGGSHAELRDQLRWVPEAPSVEDFRAAIVRAFAHWAVEDPATGLPAGFWFVEDLETEAVDDPGDPSHPQGFFGLNRGAEIDLFVEIPHAGPEFGASVAVFVDPDARELTLTSGTTGYPGWVITGADIRINPRYAWTLSAFELLLAHEIGHALGLGDVDARSEETEADLEGETRVRLDSGSVFLDDDYDPSTSARARATLTNSFALRIDPLDPDASDLVSHAGDMKGDPGLDTPGVELLMETEGIFDLLPLQRAGRPILQNDEMAARQFLYPVLPPRRGPSLASGLLLGAGLVSAGLGIGLAVRRRGPGR